MSNVEVNELISVLEGIRKEKYPDIPEDVIRKIVMAQFRNQDNPTNGRNETFTAIQDYLNTITIDQKGDE